jgi:hypothetical protein
VKLGACKLCLTEGDLQESHYLPRAVYQLLRSDGELPIVMSPSLVIQHQKQIRDFVLCRSCEQRFNNMGEDYVMRVGSRKSEFKMMDLIRACPDRHIQGEYSVYSASRVGVEADKLAYFALSVIWRGGAHVWHTFSGRATGGLQLGHHQERLRRYLTGEDPYPRGVVVKVSVACDSASQQFVEFPWINPAQQDATVFTFAVPGIWFDVAVGDSLPQYMLANCCLTLPGTPIFVGDFSRFVEDKVAQLKETARIDSKL